jgi:hypothetical protein
MLKGVRGLLLQLLLLPVCCMIATTIAMAQTIPNIPGIPHIPQLPGQKKAADTTKNDSVKKYVVKPVVKIKPFNQVINKSFAVSKGMFTVYKSRDKVYFEIPDSLLHRDILELISVAGTSYGIANYPDEYLERHTIRFEFGPDSTMNIKYELISSEADIGSNIYKAIRNANVTPVVNAISIAAYGETHKSYIVDVTDMFTGYSSFIQSEHLKTNNPKYLVNNLRDFNIAYIHTYPMNVVIGVKRNATIGTPGDAGLAGTITTNTSFLLLPKIPMARRYKDERVGYFSDTVTIFSDGQQKVKPSPFILRWRLAPRKADIGKWRSGQLVVPEKPIVIYIDPATPQQWQPYIIKGIDDWQKAFEHAGFKNAIIGKVWPKNDTTMHEDDARHSFFYYFPSTEKRTYGAILHDPRSGEILQTHIGLHANMLAVLHDKFMIQTGAVDTNARSVKYVDELMGELIRSATSQQVGHAIGLLQNLGSSSTIPVDSLRSNKYLRLHGIAPSIMDYMPFNYVAQPSDHIAEQQLLPHIGEYDRWAIEWGYKIVGAPNTAAERQLLKKLADQRITKNPKLRFNSGQKPFSKSDPRAQPEDLGNDPVKAGNYGIKNLQRMLPQLTSWAYESGGLNLNLINSYQQLKKQYFIYLQHVLSYVGDGYYQNYPAGPQKEVLYSPEPLKMQKEALAFFDRQLFQTPLWLLNESVVNRVNSVDASDFIDDTQARVLNSLFDIERLNRIRANADRFGKRTLSLSAYIGIIHAAVWRELRTQAPIMENSHRRNLQKTYLGAMLEILSTNDPTTENDATSMIIADLTQLKNELTKVTMHTKDPIVLHHFQDIRARIEAALTPKTLD